MPKQEPPAQPMPADPAPAPNSFDDPLALLRWQSPPEADPNILRSPLVAPAPSTPSKPARSTSSSRRRRDKTTRYKGITRIDHDPKRIHGYFVRVTWNGQTHSKLFSDKLHGDRLAALAAAIDWRNKTERQLGKPRSEEQVHSFNRPPGEVVGVRKIQKEGRWVYEATWREDGRVRRTSYSIAKHGEKQARALARKAREMRMILSEMPKKPAEPEVGSKRGRGRPRRSEASS